MQSKNEIVEVDEESPHQFEGHVKDCNIVQAIRTQTDKVTEEVLIAPC
jgi:hypothetical protein